MKCEKLKHQLMLNKDMSWVSCYLKTEVDAAIDELKREHHKERHEYIDMVAQHKAKLVEQESENRRLKRALYKACANWADVVAFEETEGIGHDNSVAERWRKMESKCLKKAKEYVIEHTADVINGQERELQHHKYKRCLAMADMCAERRMYWTYRLQDDGDKGYSKDYKFGKNCFWRKWCVRWLALADKFKDKEAK